MANRSNNPSPLVSVLMPVYNCAPTLREAVASILSQTLDDFELVIIDDGSTDGSREVIASFTDERIVLIDNGANLGIALTLNKGIGICRGKYIARMDGDDVCHPDRLRKQVAYLERHPLTGLCGTWAILIDAKGNAIGRAKNLTRNAELQVNLLFSVPFFHPSVMVRAQLLKSNPYDPSFPQAQDYELWTRLAVKAELANIPFYLLKYRWHGSSISTLENSAQEEKKRKVLLRQIAVLGIDACPEELKLHQAAFGKKIDRDVEPRELAAWYCKLINANNSKCRYSKPILKAYLWSRWAVFCKVNGSGRWAWFPPFASPNPVVWFYLLRFLFHFAGKRR